MGLDFPSWTILDYATLGSFVFGIVFFAYQEITGSKNRKKEVMRLKEEIINLIIRNHVNSKIRIAEVDFDILILGFEKVKDCKFHFNKKDLLEMIYAKVSENEHITNETRVEMLQQIQWIITDLRYMNEKSKNPQTVFFEFMLGSITSISISLSVLGGFYKFFNQSTIANTNTLYAVLVIIGFTFVVLKYLKPLLEDTLTTFFIDIKKEKVQSQVEGNEERDLNDISESEEYIKVNEIEVDNREVNLNNYISQATEVMRIAELRMLFEHRLRKLYSLAVKDNEKMHRAPVIKIITSLMVSNIIEEGLGSEMKKMYSASSAVMHELELPKNYSVNKVISLFEATIEIINREIKKYDLDLKV